MAERAAHLIDHVFPDVPIRQWVLSLPPRLRHLLAWDHDLCRAVSVVAVRAVLGFLRRRARRERVADGRSGAVVVVQRFGGALNLNIHLHARAGRRVHERPGRRQDLPSAGAGETPIVCVAPAIGSAARAFGRVDSALPVKLL
jgi:hypothetical protein